MSDGFGLRMPFMNPWSGDGNPMGFARPQTGLRQSPYQQPVGWTPAKESSFVPWMNANSASAGTNANADHQLHSYNYRKLFESGQGLSLDASDNMLHGSSQFKQPDHPNRFVISNGRLIDSVTGGDAYAAILAEQLLRSGQ